MEPFLSASRIVNLIRERRVTCEEATRFFLDRISQLNPQLNAVCEINPDAISQAKLLDGELNRKNGIIRPLHGLPISIKVSQAVKGLRCTMALKKWKDHIAQEDSSVVKFLKEAGCVILCTTTMPEMGVGVDSNSVLYGVTKNPWNFSRTAGGSSSGEASLIAAGCSPLGIGTDIGGSVRLPAHCTGISGLIAQSGRIPMANLGAPVDFRGAGLNQIGRRVGPMARDVNDLLLVLPYMSGPDGIDPYSILPTFTPQAVDLSKLRVSWYTGHEHNLCNLDTHNIVAACAEALKPVTACVKQDTFDSLWDAYQIYFSYLCRDGGKSIYKQQATLGKGAAWMSQSTQDFKTDSRRELERRIRKMDMFRSKIVEFMSNYDIILCPVCPSPAYKEGEEVDVSKYVFHCVVFNMAQLPAVSAGPMGFSTDKSECAGLPINVQVVGRPMHEHTALAVSKFLQDKFESLKFRPAHFSTTSSKL